MTRLLATLLVTFLASCVSSASREMSTAFATLHQPTHEELLALLDDLDWQVQDEAYGFHEDPRGLTGDRYLLERFDSRGHATLFVFAAPDGTGSVLIDVTEEVSRGRAWKLFDGLRKLYEARPSWRDPGVVYCVDHDPRHIAKFRNEAEREAALEKLKAQSGCSQLGWNLPR